MSWEHRSQVAVVGVGFSAIERRSSIPIGKFAEDAVNDALADCGLTLDQIDGLATYPSAPFAGALNRDGEDVVTVEYFLGQTRPGNIVWYSQAGLGLIAASFRDATNALISGACNYVLLWRAMYVPPGSYGRIERQRAAGDSQFTAPYGVVSPIQVHAFAYRRYLERYGASRESMATLALNSRRNANLNEHAVFADRPLTRDDYLSARMVSDPLCLLDCDVPVTACVAAVMTTADRARDLRQPPTYVAGVAQQANRRAEAIEYTLHDHIDQGKPMVDELWRQSGLGAGDMSAAELYDGFGPSTLYWLEAAGFCGRGEALDFVQDGRVAIDGQLPLNTFGGSLSQGRLHGMGHIADAVIQLRGQAGQRQVKDPTAVIVLDGSPMLRCGGLILTSEAI